MAERPPRRRSSFIGSFGIIAGLWLASAVLAVAASDPSPGCVAWNAIGPAGRTGDSMVVDGPFLGGETIKFEIDPVTSPTLILRLDYDTQSVDIGTDRSPFSFKLPHKVQQIAIYGEDNDHPGIWKLIDFECVGAAAAPDPAASAPPAPATDAVLGPPPPRDEILGPIVIVASVTLGGASLMAAAWARRSRTI